MPDTLNDNAAYLARLYAPERRRHACRATTSAECAAWAAAARPALHELIGLGRIAASLGDFTPSVTLDVARDDCGDHTRQAGTLHAEPGFDVPFWYLRPKASGPHPVGLFPHGHYGARGLDKAAGIARDDAERQLLAAEDRDVGVQAVRLGFAALCPATRGFDPAGIADATNRHGGAHCRCHTVHALLGGRTGIGERVWDLMRLLDWAATQPDLDVGRTLVLGNSGGGVVTLYASACDVRVRVGVASCSFCTYVGRNGAVHHCDCNAVPGILQFGEFHDVAGLAAPRHLLVVHGRTDPLFPLSEVERAVAGTRRIFAAAGVPTHFAQHWGDGGHRFYRDLMWPWVTAALG